MSIRHSASETVWGRSARWLGGLPAIVAATFAILSTAYALWVLPGNAKEKYTAYLESASERYAEMREGGEQDFGNIQQVAGDLNVVYNRLVILSGGDPEVYWKWASFADDHAGFLEGLKSELSGDDLEQAVADASQYSARAQDTYEYLSFAEGPVAAKALERHAQRVLAASLAGDYRQNLNELADRIDSQAASQNSGLVMGLRLEGAFGGSDQSLLSVEPSVIDELRVQSSVSQESDSLAKAYFALFNISSLESFSTDSQASETASWMEQYAQVLGAVAEGDWKDVAFLLAKGKDGEYAEALRLGTARWICRLAVSEKAKTDEAWREDYASGLQIVVQVAPQLPELSELIWLLGKSHAEVDEGDRAGIAANQTDAPGVTVDPRLVETVIGGRAVVVRHTVLAIAKSLEGNPQVMRSHLQLAKRSAGTLQLISQVILGRLYAGIEGAEQEAATGLLNTIVELEPEAGLHWFVLGVAGRNSGNLDEAEKALARAVELLPEVDVVKNLHEKVREERQRAHRPTPLRPVE